MNLFTCISMSVFMKIHKVRFDDNKFGNENDDKTLAMYCSISKFKIDHNQIPDFPLKINK